MSDAPLTDIQLCSKDVLMLQNEIPQSSNEGAVKIAKGVGARIVFNPAPYRPLSDEERNLIDYLILNESEFSEFAGAIDVSTPAQVIGALGKLHDIEPAIIVTLGAHGVVYRDEDSLQHIKGHTINVVDTTGAGDCFSGAFAAAISMGQDTESAATYANAAAALSVTHLGAGPSMPTKSEIEKFLSLSHG